jgi:N-ethylmaleimide reductase
VSHPSLQPSGGLPCAPSALRPNTRSYTETGFQPCVTPRALEVSEIPDIVEQYRTAARNAIHAGFDGVEIHAANGYLLEQFLRDSTNRRADGYGGSRENRARLLLEVVEAVAAVVGREYVGVRLSPLSPANDIGPDSDPAGTYQYVVDELNAFGLAYIHVVEGATQGPRKVAGGFDLQVLRRSFKGAYIANNGHNRELALAARGKNSADFIAFGRSFISNPDLVERPQKNAPLTSPDQDSFFGGGAKGYTDYPALTSC